jgi:hypothetical protein
VAQFNPECASRIKVERMVAALGGWEKAARRLARTGRLTEGGETAGYVLYCVLCGSKTASFPSLSDDADVGAIEHDPECFITIARLVLGA